MADAAVVAPDAEAALIGLAGRESVKALRDEGARRKQAHLDDNARYEAIRASRHLRYGTDPDGAATMGARTTPEAMAEIKAAIAYRQTKIFDTARKAGLRDRFEAYAADALLDMARASMGHTGEATPKRVPTKIIIRVDHTALVRGHVQPGEVCDIAGTGPIPVRQVAQMLATGDTFAAVIATDHAGQVTTVAHIGHKPVTLTQPPLASGELERHGRGGAQRVTSAGPAAESELASGPAAPAGGRTREAQTRNTQLDELDGYGAHHHALKTRNNYQLAPGTGRRPLHAPTGTDPP